MISSELPEVLRMSHRIVVMSEGRITGELASRRGHPGARHALATLRPGREPRGRGRARPGSTPRSPRQQSRRPMTSPDRHPAATTPDRTAPDAARRTLRQRLQQLLAFASLIVIFVFFSIRQPELLQLRQRHQHPVLHGGHRHAGPRHHVRDHHRRDRPVHRHRDVAVRGDVRGASSSTWASRCCSGCSARSLSAG